jgi:pheromone shutdown protein TraB
MITLIGTGHVFDLTAPLLTVLDSKDPDCVCVELDPQRYEALMHRQAGDQPTGTPDKSLPLIYRLLARFQENMAHQYGVQAGSEMLTAINYASTHQLPLEFIDVNAQQLFTRMWRTMPMTEKLKLFLSGFTGLFVSRKQVESELKKYENDFDAYIQEIGTRFPTIKKVLIDDRNTAMANNLIALNDKYLRIVACVGDGHIPGLSAILQDHKIYYETIRLPDLQRITPEPTDGATASFSTTYSDPTSD